MISYQQAYRPAFGRASLSQPSSPASIPPPAVDPLYVGYTGVPGFLEALLVLSISGAAAWVGIRTGMSEKKNDYVKMAGWIGGVGAGLLGVLYLGAKSGATQMVGLPIPAVRVSPT